MSFERSDENFRSENSAYFRVAHSSRHEAEPLLQASKISLVPVSENIEESGEETNDLKRGCEGEVKVSSTKQATNTLRESSSKSYRSFRSANSPYFRVADSSHHEAECIFQETKIPLDPVSENIKKLCEENGTTNDVYKRCEEEEVTISSNEQVTSTLRESSSKSYESFRSANSPYFRVADSSHHEAECLFQGSRIPLDPVSENIKKLCEGNGTTIDLNKRREEEEEEVTISSKEQVTGALIESPSLDFETIWSDALIPDLKPTEEIPYDLKPRADSLILDLVRRGIEVSLDQLEEQKLTRDVLTKDFSTVEKILFARTGPNVATRNFSFCVHAPIAFKFFRELFGISTECFRHSICREPLCQLDGYSQTGSMYTSYDDRFILKICQRKESAFLESIFPSYFANVTKQPKTLLPKFFGLYGYKEGNLHVHFLIMNNLVPIFVNLHEKYDLKGSTYSKRKSKKLQEMKLSYNEKQEEILGSLITLKDLDFLQRWPGGLYLKKKFHSLLMQSVERDCKILQAHEIIDYSLLLGIHVPGNIYWSQCDDHDSSPSVYKISKLEAARVRKIKNLIGPFEAHTSQGCRVHLYLGIIDILQSYTIRKKCEHFCKLLFYSSNTMSVVSPDAYAERFKNFLKQSVFKCIPELIPFPKKEKELVQKLLEDFSDDVEIWC